MSMTISLEAALAVLHLSKPDKALLDDIWTEYRLDDDEQIARLREHLPAEPPVEFIVSDDPGFSRANLLPYFSQLEEAVDARLEIMISQVVRARMDICFGDGQERDYAEAGVVTLGKPVDEMSLHELYEEFNGPDDDDDIDGQSGQLEDEAACLREKARAEDAQVDFDTLHEPIGGPVTNNGPCTCSGSETGCKHADWCPLTEDEAAAYGDSHVGGPPLAALIRAVQELLDVAIEREERTYIATFSNIKLALEAFQRLTG